MSGFVARMQLALVLALLVCSQSQAHDSWISRGGLRNAAGEWCCGEGDCFTVPGDQVHVTAGGYTLFNKALFLRAAIELLTILPRT